MSSSEDPFVEPSNETKAGGASNSKTPKERFKQMAASKQNGAGGDVDEEETHVWQGSYSHLAMIGTWIAGGLATVIAPVMALLMNLPGNYWLTLIGILALIWIGMWGLYAYRRYSVHYKLSSQRFVHESGLLWRTVDRVELIDIDDVTYVQGPVERAFSVGTIRLSSSDKTTPELALPGIANVREVADMIDDARRKERRSRGLHIEQV